MHTENNGLVSYLKKLPQGVHEHWFETKTWKSFFNQLALGVFAGIGLQKMDELYQSRILKKISPINPPFIKTLLSKPYSKWPFIASVTVIVPLAEEIFYRGLIREDQKYVYNHEHSRKDATVNMVVNAALFAIAHYWNRQSLKAMPYYFLAGCVLYQLADQHNNLIAPVVAHSIKNGLALRSLKG